MIRVVWYPASCTHLFTREPLCPVYPRPQGRPEQDVDCCDDETVGGREAEAGRVQPHHVHAAAEQPPEE